MIIASWMDEHDVRWGYWRESNAYFDTSGCSTRWRIYVVRVVEVFVLRKTWGVSLYGELDSAVMASATYGCLGVCQSIRASVIRCDEPSTNTQKLNGALYVLMSWHHKRKEYWIWPSRCLATEHLFDHTARVWAPRARVLTIHQGFTMSIYHRNFKRIMTKKT